MPCSRPSQWVKLIGWLGEIDYPVVDEQASTCAVPVPVAGASAVHRGE
jgi:hypothetical protein